VIRLNEIEYQSFKNMVQEVITLLEKEIHKNPNRMKDWILNRYRQALMSLKSNQNVELSIIEGYLRECTRAYLEASSDYLNPLLEQMNQVEKHLKLMLLQQRNLENDK
jgi:hypothetical protein